MIKTEDVGPINTQDNLICHLQVVYFSRLSTLTSSLGGPYYSVKHFGFYNILNLTKNYFD